MSNKEGDNVTSSDEIPSKYQFVDDVIKSCKNLKIDHERQIEEAEEVDECEDRTVHDDFIDDIMLKDLELTLTPEELENNKLSATRLKNHGNTLFKEKDYERARVFYTRALKICPLSRSEERAILFSNRAACKMSQELKNEAIADCDRAIELNPTYVRALSRRAKLYESTEKLDEALEDYKKILELDPGNGEARAACARLPGEINKRNEKLKEEMLSSLKELGNKLLKPFGLSTNNFQVQKDPNSGGYSINFNQNPK
ncbi:UNVERIFIED_CONTAM: hypothetical protein PYX00_004701 [Menopon gallinae]|uniref:Tetratricopeptide repeat protein 1 n=1 Tax=Menopon gallinae TaxID=328185 RepID=A0AAW2I6F1_9NEOP